MNASSSTYLVCRIIMVTVAVLLTCADAMAQSSVTLYGLIDESIRYQSHPNSASARGSTVSVAEGAISGNRFGMRGDEDLGGGSHAIFGLESGFNVASGKFDQQGQLFGRFAWVGLSNQTFGTLKVGRQYSNAFNFDAFTFDPIGGGNVTATDWESFLIGVRYDNTLDYKNQFGPVGIELQQSLGGQAGSFAEGSTSSGSLYYSFSSAKIGVLGQESKDAASHKLIIGSAGANYAPGALKFSAYYIYAKRDAGFQIGAVGTALPLANTSILNNAVTAFGPQTAARTDQFFKVGATYQMRPDVHFMLAYAYDHATNVAPSANGTMKTLYGIADYNLSKRTDIYLEVDDSRLSGASVNDPNSPLSTAPGVRQVFGASLSLRTLF
jgi:predicted porin